MQLKVGGKFHLKLNMGARPIANKYREGKMKRTLKRELKSTWNCWKGIESFPVLSCSIFQYLFVDSALCYNVTSKWVDFVGNGVRGGSLLVDVIALALVVMEETEASTCNGFVGVYVLVICKDSLLCFWIYYFMYAYILAVRDFWQNGAICPVLKHGPRSLTCVQVLEC